MTDSVDVKLFFNFRSPYCYIASKTLFQIYDEYDVGLVWRPLGGWSGRSPPDRAKIKIPLTRQDIRRITAKMGIPMNPPPITTDPTIAGAASLLAQEKGLLREWIVEVMRAEWANGLDIGDEQVLCDVGESIGLEKEALQAAFTNPEYLQQMDDNWAEAQALGLIGVPSFQIDEEQFWGADRIEYVLDHLQNLRLRKV
ncbi:2-hydroxychromene-2-carboxylate isomerase [Halieaceae bacterium IMCC8485]|uniref:2-hydroxychromene-2-carboxylate isomerase n=1 Tax=Candidatus Seongchinamella marina TaxID=2518990 RepID=A0ABT3T1V9_9GAMM|nr:DsbA family protein [Candidatus Seongchinamella marina]MCX2975509.1 2-hydroxychromene-2-carboxylate isomerase [Candidatus Seongchinamella marina]